MDTKNRIFKALQHSFVSQVLSILSQLILIPSFLYFWGIEKYGIWLTIVAFSQWFLLVDFGLGHYLPNKLTLLKNRNKLKEYNFVLTTFISFNLILSFLFIIIGILISLLIGNYNIIKLFDICTNNELIITLSIFISYNIFLSITSFSPIVYISSSKYYMPTLRKNQNIVLNLILIPIALYFNASFVVIISIMFFNVMVIEFISLKDIIINYNFAELKLIKLRFKLIKKYYLNGIWFMGAKLYDINYQSLPILLIQYFISPSAVVIFTIHRTIANIVMQLRQFTASIIWRESTILYANKDMKILRSMYLFIQKSSLYFTLIFSCIIITYGEDIFTLWLHKNDIFDFQLLVLMLAVVLVQSLWINAETFLYSWNNAKSVVIYKTIYLILYSSLSTLVLFYSKNLYLFVILNVVLNILVLNVFIVNKLHQEINIRNKIYFKRILIPFLLFMILTAIILYVLIDSYIMASLYITILTVLLGYNIKISENKFVNVLLLNLFNKNHTKKKEA